MLSKWKMLLSKYDIVYVTQKTITGESLMNHLVENPIDNEYEPLQTYLPNEKVLFIEEDIVEVYPGWRMFSSQCQRLRN